MNIEPKDRVVGELLRAAAEKYPERPLLQFGDDTYSYERFDRLANTVANGLAELGLEKEGKLAIMVPNDPAYVQSWFAAARLGVVYVPINTDYKGDILRYQLDKADVTHMVIAPDYLERLDAVIADLPKLKHVIVNGPADVPERIAGAAKVTTMGTMLSAPDRDPGVVVRHCDPHAISFTSGTTGPSKGVLASHCHVVTFARDWMIANDLRPGEGIYSCLPLFHAIASWLGVLPAIMAGGRIAFAERFSASRFWDDIRRYDSSVAHGIFSLVPVLLKQPTRPDDADQPARVLYFAQRSAEFETRFNCRIVEVYGATETGIVTMTPYDEASRPGSCGRANDETFEVMVVDDDDNPLPPGEIGEIVVRPRHAYAMLSEYYSMPAETVAAFRNLWFHTGDNARMDEDGYFYFVDRKKDAIRRRGENISSYEVESVFNRHAGVLECAAVAVPSEFGEDEVKVVVVRRAGHSVTAEELWAFCDDAMPKFWVPRYIEFRDALPKTANQKIQKYRLRGDSGAGELYDRDRG